MNIKSADELRRENDSLDEEIERAKLQQSILQKQKELEQFRVKDIQ